MITVNYSISNEYIESVEISGHANFSEYGQDIVCAAVSSQAISVENSLQHLLEIPVKTEVDEVDGGYLKMTLPKISSKHNKNQAELLMRHLIFALERLAESYPEYIQIQNYNAN